MDSILVPILTSCLNMGNLLNAPNLVFLMSEMGKKNSTYLRVAIRKKVGNKYKAVSIVHGTE